MRVFLIRFRVVLVMEIRCIFSKLFSKLLQEKQFERNCPRLRRGISNFNESFRSWITTRGHFGGTYTPEEVLKKEVIPDLGKWVNNRVVNGGEKKIKEDKKKQKTRRRKYARGRTWWPEASHCCMETTSSLSRLWPLSSFLDLKITWAWIV